MRNGQLLVMHVTMGKHHYGGSDGAGNTELFPVAQWYFLTLGCVANRLLLPGVIP